MTEKFQRKLSFLIRGAKRWMLKYLRDNGLSKRLELERYVINILNIKERRDGTILHRTKPIHGLAFILAYKELESMDQIEIQRPTGVPFPMTDFETLFSVN